MRFLWLNHFAPYPSTGHGALQRTHHLFTQTARRHEVDLVALVPAGTLATADAVAEAREALAGLAASVTLVPLPTERRRLRQVQHVLQSLATGRTYWEHLFDAAPAHRALAALRPPGGYDVVHVDTAYLAPYEAAWAGRRWVLHHHNVESHLLDRRAEQASGPARAYMRRQAEGTRRLETRLAATASHNVVVSDLDGERLRELVPDALVSTVPNGVDVDFFTPSADATPRPKSLVWAGGMDWYPNADAITWLATEIWPRLAADDPERTLTIIGRNPPAEARALAARDERVRVLGFVDDVRPYIRGSAAYLCPIRVGGGTRLKVLDALALGIPLVGTDIGVEGLGLQPGVHYAAANDPDATVAAVRRLEGDPALAARMAAAGRALVVEQYAWTRVGVLLDAVYRSVVGDAVSRPSASSGAGSP